MPSIYQLKPRFQGVLRPLACWLYARGITANLVTIGACIGSLGVAVVVAASSSVVWTFSLIPAWMLVRMALNAMDGMLAREFGQQSNLGAYLNELCDVVADSALFMPFSLLPGVNPAWVALVTLLAVISEYAGVLGPMIGASRRYDGPMGKSDRAFCFGAIGAGAACGTLPAGWINAALILMTALLLYTIYNRLHHGLMEAA